MGVKRRPIPGSFERLKGRVVRILEHKRLPWMAAVLALALASPSISSGLIFDDYFHHAALLGLPEMPKLARSPVDLFAFYGEHWDLDSRLLPWWTSPGLRLALFRPLTSLTHALDLVLWPDQPHWMHLHSLLWLAAMVVVACYLFRRLLSPTMAPWVAGFAGLLFAVDDAHATPAAWIANRNATVAAVFAIASILVYDRWRREGWRPGIWLTPLLLGLGLLGGEIAVAGGAYLLGYALFVDRGSLKRRLLAVVPSAAVGTLWWLVYKALGYGVSNSGVYIDPSNEPLRFSSAVLERAPVLLMGQLGFPPADLTNMASPQTARLLWLFSVFGLTLLAVMVSPLLKRDRTSRFWAFGMVLALLPGCATAPGDRLLVMCGLGGMALVAIFVASALGETGNSLSLTWRRVARPLACALVLIHLVLAPFVMYQTINTFGGFGAVVRRISTTFPADAQVARQHVVVTHTPTLFFTTYAPVMNALVGRSIPADLSVLSSSVYPVEVERVDEKTMVVRPEGGFFQRPGTEPPGRTLPPIAPIRLLQSAEWLCRRIDEPCPVDPFVHNGLTIEVLEQNTDGLPAAVSYRFPLPLEDPQWRWVRWLDGSFVDFQPPPIGERVRLASIID